MHSTHFPPDFWCKVTHFILIAIPYGNQLLKSQGCLTIFKGAVGQAVQNMNIMFGIDETAGLRLKKLAQHTLRILKSPINKGKSISFNIH